MRYQLIDFGDGQKWESIGSYRLCRPSPAAADLRPGRRGDRQPIDATYQRTTGDRGTWQFARPWPPELIVDGSGFSLFARPTPFGHIGLFPEQAPNWEWIGQQVSECGQPEAPARVLNLFAYTGASTLAAAAAGALVAHVDAARPNVEAAKQNAELSGLGDAPIRYLVDDARKFVAREIRRGRRYDLVVLDPPAYGHAERGRAWRLERDLWPLMAQCRALLADNRPRRVGILLSGHSPQIGPLEVQRYIASPRAKADRLCPRDMDCGRLQIQDSQGRSLDAGFYARLMF